MDYISKHMNGDWLLCLWDGGALYSKDCLSKCIEKCNKDDFGEKESEKIRDMVFMACEMGACLVCDHAVKVLVAQIHLLVKPVFSVVLFF